MTHPQNKEEYLARFNASQRYEGSGIDTTVVMPCPFCAAPNWCRARVLSVEAEMSKDFRCDECGRSSKTIFQHDSNGVTFEIVQTGGPDQPSWFEPKMRRVNA